MTTALPLIGPYRTLSVLGGTMGTVFRAAHRDTGALVALKVGTGADARTLAAVRREVHALSRVQHAGIVRILDDGIDAGRPWFAMELLEGRTARTIFDTWHAPATPAPLAERVALLGRLCAPLAHIHERGIVHCDLKPENVHVRDDGHPVLVDFGLLSRCSDVTGREVLEVAGVLAGTAAYIAPERIRGELIDARADLYSLGCMLYEAITGAPPFTGSAQEMCHQHLNAAPAPPSSRAEDVPAWLDDLVLELLEKSRRARLGYADAIAARLRARLGVVLADGAATGARAYLYRPELVGRAAAVARLGGCLERAFEGRGTLIFVSGESGIGKTRVAIETGTLAVERGFTVISGECVAIATDLAAAAGAALHPFRALFNVVADRCRSGGPSETDRLLGARGPVLAVYEPSLAALPGQAAQPRPPEVSPEATLERVCAAIFETLAALATCDAPVLLMLDDVHWADEVSLHVLAGLPRARLAELPVIVLATYRGEEMSPRLREVVERAGAEHVVLDRLREEGIRRMVGDMLALPSAPKEFVDSLFERTDGNPFFVSEYLHVAAGQRYLYRDDAGRWQLARPDGANGRPLYTLPIPRSIRAVVRIRLEALTDVQRRVLELAAVLGRTVEEALLLRASEHPEAAVTDALDELIRRHVLERDDGGSLGFAHARIREVTYEEIPERLRPGLHLRAAHAIEAHVGDATALAHQYGALAHHWSRAAAAPDATHALVARAVDALERAGEQAARNDANAEAVRLFDEAVRLHTRADDGQSALRRARWERHLAEAHFRLGDLEACRRHVQSALALMGQPVRVGRAQLARGLAVEAARQLWHRLASHPAARATRRGHAGRLDAARAYELLGFVQLLMVERVPSLISNLRALNLAERTSPSPVLALTSAVIGMSTGMVFGARIARRYFDLGLATARVLDDDYARGRAAHIKGFYLIGRGCWPEAAEALEEALESFVRVGDGRWRDSVTLTLGNLDYMHRRSGCLRRYEDGRRSSRRRGDVQSEAWGALGEAAARLARGEADAALASLDSTTPWLGETFARLGDTTSELCVYGIRAAAELRRGDLNAATGAVTRAYDLVGRASGLLYHALPGYAYCAEVTLRLWERDHAPGSFAAMARGATNGFLRFASTFPIARPQAYVWRGLLRWLDGNRRRAYADWDRALALATRLDMPFDCALAHYEIGRHLSSGNVRYRHLDEAQASFRALGATYEARCAEALLAAARGSHSPAALRFSAYTSS